LAACVLFDEYDVFAIRTLIRADGIRDVHVSRGIPYFGSRFDDTDLRTGIAIEYMHGADELDGENVVALLRHADECAALLALRLPQQLSRKAQNRLAGRPSVVACQHAADLFRHV